MEKLTSRKNPVIQHLRRLAADSGYRNEQGEYVLDGVKLLREAMAFGGRVGCVLWPGEPEFTVPGANIYTAPKDLVEYASPLKNSPGPVFTVAIPGEETDRPLENAIVLENVQDPGNVGTLLLQAVYPFLWTCLLIVPGFIKAYEYCMIPYLLADHPEMTRQEAFATSKAMMKGNKWKAFVLDLSFIPWDILSALTLGIVSVFYVAPYRQLTAAALYEKLKAQNEVPAAEVPAQGE